MSDCAPGNLPPAYVLAGGRSSRFPGDKALAVIHGQRQLPRLLDQLAEHGHQVRVVADSKDRYTGLGIECLVDLYPNSGPLSGLITALQDRLDRLAEGWVLLLTCDQLIWHSSWLTSMSRLWVGGNDSTFNVGLWAPTNPASGYLPTPIPGAYHTSLLPVLHLHWRQRELALKSLLGDPQVRVLYDYRESQLPQDYTFNTPSQLELLLENERMLEN